MPLTNGWPPELGGCPNFIAPQLRFQKPEDVEKIAIGFGAASGCLRLDFAHRGQLGHSGG